MLLRRATCLLVALVSHHLNSRHESTMLTRVAVDYGASTIVAKSGDTADQGDGTDVSVDAKNRVESTQSLAKGILVGKRIPSVKVLNQSDARPWHLQELLPSIGRWRIIVFPGDITKPAQAAKLKAVGDAFEAKNSWWSRYTPKGAHYDEVFEVLAVHHAPRTSVTIFDFPTVFRNFDETDGWDYMKIYADDVSYHEGHGKIYEEFGISEDGCIVVVRPDQYVSYVGSMEDTAAVDKFFSGFMKESQAKIVNGSK